MTTTLPTPPKSNLKRVFSNTSEITMDEPTTVAFHERLLSNKSFLITLFTLLSSANIIIKKVMMVYMYNYPSAVTILQALRNIIMPVAAIVIVTICSDGSNDSNEDATNATSKTRFNEMHLRQLNPFNVPWKFHFTLGFFDAMINAGTYFSYTYLPGRLLILLQQGLIPLNTFLFWSTFNKKQIVGSVFIFVGIAWIYFGLWADTEQFEYCHATHPDNGDECSLCRDIENETECNSNENAELCEYGEDETSFKVLFRWSLILGLSCIPQFISIHLKAGENSPVLNNSSVTNLALSSFANFGYTVAFTVMLAWLSEPTILPKDWKENIVNGRECYQEINSVDTGCYTDDCYLSSRWVNIYMVVNVMYQALIFYISNHPEVEDILLISQSLTVPICSIFFVLPNFPMVEYAPSWSSWSSLIFVVLGLIVFRQGTMQHLNSLLDENEDDGDMDAFSDRPVVRDDEELEDEFDTTTIESSMRRNNRTLSRSRSHLDTDVSSHMSRRNNRTLSRSRSRLDTDVSSQMSVRHLFHHY